MDRVFLIIVGLAIVCAGRLLPAGEIDAVRESVTTDEPRSEPAPSQSRKPSPSSRKKSCDDDEYDRYFKEQFVSVVFQTVISPWSFPIILLDDDYGDYAGVVPQPYRDEPFALRHETGRAGPLPEVFGRLQLDFASNLDGLSQVGGQVLVETPQRFGIDASLSHWWEGDVGVGDSLQLGDANVVFRFAQSDQLQFRSGLGVNWIAGYSAADIGFNFTYGADYYPRQPLVFSTTFDLGTLGHAGLFHNQTTVGVVVRSCEIFTGYDYRRIGKGELDGWITGVRWRF